MSDKDFPGIPEVYEKVQIMNAGTDPVPVFLPPGLAVSAKQDDIIAHLNTIALNALTDAQLRATPIKINLTNAAGAYIKAIPDVLISGSGGESGPAPRVKVDPGQSGFFEGKMFRAFITGVVPVAGPAHYFKFVSPIDFILWSQDLDITQGALQLEIFGGATESGVWTDITTMVGVNRMAGRPSPYYNRQAALMSGGTFTGGTLLDVLHVRSAQNNSNAGNVGGAFTERGLPAGTYYGKISTLAGGLTVNDPGQYVYTLVWEERT